jgi:hypothetical protein
MSICRLPHVEQTSRSRIEHGRFAALPSQPSRRGRARPGWHPGHQTMSRTPARSGGPKRHRRAGRNFRWAIRHLPREPHSIRCGKVIARRSPARPPTAWVFSPPATDGRRVRGPSRWPWRGRTFAVTTGAPLEHPGAGTRRPSGMGDGSSRATSRHGAMIMGDGEGVETRMMTEGEIRPSRLTPK